MRDCASPITKASDKLRTSQSIGSSVTFPATRIGSPFKAINFCCTSGTVRKYIVLPVAPENIRYATEVTITTTPMDNFTCCLDTSSTPPKRHCHPLLKAMASLTCMYSNNSPPPLIVTMTPLGYIERLVPRELDIFQRSMELWPKLCSVFPCALTLYHIYMYNQQNPLRWSAHAPQDSALDFGTHDVSLSAALWKHRGHHVGGDDHASHFSPHRAGARGHAHAH